MDHVSRITYHKSEQGVTLLLSVLILAGMTLITLAVGAFAISEIRSSRAVVLTEPAIAAAETAGEQGLWLIKRKDSSDPSQLIKCTSGSSTAVLSGNAMVNSCRKFTKATFNLKANQPFSFLLYDPDNENGDIDLSGFPYSSISIAHVSGTTAVNISVLRLDNSIAGINPTSSNVNPGNTQVVNITPVSSGSEGRMRVTLVSSADVTVEANTDQGMPTIPTIDATACSSKTPVNNCSTVGQEIFTRRVNVTVQQ